jgi:SNF2 family DNA or RNA helicase
LRNAMGGRTSIRLEGIGDMAITDLSREHIISELQRREVWFPTIPQIRGYQHEDELRDKIAPYTFRCRLEDCYDMPASVYMKREVTMPPEQRRIYEELKTFHTAQLDAQSFVTATQVITVMLRLHQVLCGHVTDEQGNEHEIETNRTKVLLECLEEVEDTEKVIIWCIYDADIQRVVAALRHTYGEGSVARFWGGNRKTREAEEHKFKTDPSVRFMVATQSAGGRGRTWDMANTVIYYSNSDNLDYRSQSEERPKAMNKTIPIAYIDLVVPGTVDEKFIISLRRKIDMATAITGDNYMEWLI